MSGGSPPAGGSSSGAGGGKVILVVEDDLSVRQMIVDALSKQYRIVQAGNGLEASELLGTMTPDLVICDVMMPKVDGFSFIRRMRAREALQKIPVIFLTAKTDSSNVIKGIQLGAKHYIQKPFSVKDLVEKVTKLLR